MEDLTENTLPAEGERREQFRLKDDRLQLREVFCKDLVESGKIDFISVSAAFVGQHNSVNLKNSHINGGEKLTEFTFQNL